MVRRASLHHDGLKWRRSSPGDERHHLHHGHGGRRARFSRECTLLACHTIILMDRHYTQTLSRRGMCGMHVWVRAARRERERLTVRCQRRTVEWYVVGVCWVEKCTSLLYEERTHLIELLLLHLGALNCVVCSEYSTDWLINWVYIFVLDVILYVSIKKCCVLMINNH